MTDNNNSFLAEVKAYVKENYATQGGAAIGARFGMSKDAIRAHAWKMGIRLSPETERRVRDYGYHKDIYRVDAAHFTTSLTKEGAYLLGFLWADGSIRDGKGYAIKLQITEADARQIEPTVDKTGTWSKYVRKPPAKHPHYQTTITFVTSNRCIHEFLGQCNYSSKSASPDKILSHIPEHLRHYWWRGYFDGDGCLYVKSKQRAWQIVLTSEAEQDWSFAESLLKELGCRYKVNVRESLNPVGMSSEVRMGAHESCKRFLDYIYQERNIDHIGLTRKYDKYLEFLALEPPKSRQQVP